jgi:hypothetical protein
MQHGMKLGESLAVLGLVVLLFAGWRDEAMFEGEGEAFARRGLGFAGDGEAQTCSRIRIQVDGALN